MAAEGGGVLGVVAAAVVVGRGGVGSGTVTAGGAAVVGGGGSGTATVTVTGGGVGSGAGNGGKAGVVRVTVGSGSWVDAVDGTSAAAANPHPSRASRDASGRRRFTPGKRLIRAARCGRDGCLPRSRMT